ncbi:hypothetical protein [Blautia hydrogenotrophica]|uniref:hypothetical protein n=1 Tax=Blautia hydrogenotrophica TaxID=53443 RepID=UPI003A8427B1
MKEHLLQIDNFRFEQQNFQSSINLSIYKRELIAVCSPSFLDVDKLQENYKRRLLKGTLFFKSQPPQLLSKGKPLKYFYTISKYSHLISSLSISDNIFAIRRSSFPNLFYIPKYAKIAAEDLLKEFKLSISIHTPVSELTKAQQHLLLILKAYISSAKIIFLDDFVESYTYAEFQQFLTLIRQLRDREITFLVFSKSPSLVTQNADRIFVVSDDGITNILSHENYHADRLSALILGKTPELFIRKKSCQQSGTLMNLDWSSFLHGLKPLTLHRQECLCIFDFYDSHIANLYNFFVKKFPYCLGGKTCTNYTSAIQNGLAPIDLSNMMKYFFPDLSLGDNLTLSILNKINTFGVIDRKLWNYCVNSSIREMKGHPIENAEDLFLFLLMKWKLKNPSLLLLSDFNTTYSNRSDLYQNISQINQEGAALVLLSTNLWNCLYFADTLLAIKNTDDYRIFHKEDSKTFEDKVKNYLYGTKCASPSQMPHPLNL